MKTVKGVAGLIVASLMLSGCGEESEGGDSSSLSPELLQGKAHVESICIACHGQGLNGAPILGNKKMWGKRIVQGEDTLVSHAANGFGLMPARGGSDLNDDEIRQAVRYMMHLVSDNK
ncbi:MAG: c-type cytochrome [Pontibacterium sp.]